MTDQTAEAVDRLRLVIGGLRSEAERARKTAKRSKRDKLLWECRADMFDKDAAAIATLLADRERLQLALEQVRLTQHPGIAWAIAEAALNTQGEGE